MYLMLSTACTKWTPQGVKPISAMSLSRQLGIQYRTCWHLLHRLRAMLAGDEKLPLAGVIEADETCRRLPAGDASRRQGHEPAEASG